MEIFSQVEFWYWWVLAAFFLALEIFAPGAFFLVIGVASVLVGFLALAVPSASLEVQLLAFAVLSVIGTYGWWIYRKRVPAPATDQPSLNRRGSQYVDRTFTLSEPIVNGQGKLKIDDTVWKVVGSDLPQGTQVKVTGVDGTLLTVEPT